MRWVSSRARRSGLAATCCSLLAMSFQGSVVPLSFQVLTWNTLAPPYYRDGTRAGLTEASVPGAAVERHSEIISKLRQLRPAIVCLQEFWFDPALLGVYEQAFTDEYDMLALRRTGMNCNGRSEDGVAILVDRSVFRVLRRHDVLFQDYGIPQDRIALLAFLEPVSPRLADSFNESETLAVLCTHLTYPHNSYDERSRQRQIGACLHAVNSETPSGAPVLVCGDFNGPTTDAVGAALAADGFSSAWEEVHGKPCAVTHVDHRQRQFACDHALALAGQAEVGRKWETIL
eukprot:TRINITY_DN3208_c0_g1_i4.p1 TRINITY_DN3208_c0_g1~~TRINITY_DN3208_c0_g1_i4.p1  ORF type:complete len:288 (-),score=24.26 TRINITY_DN3208_c0_g1_i4:1255-2118(-)